MLFGYLYNKKKKIKTENQKINLQKKQILEKKEELENLSFYLNDFLNDSIYQFENSMKKLKKSQIENFSQKKKIKIKEKESKLIFLKNINNYKQEELIKNKILLAELKTDFVYNENFHLKNYVIL